MSLYFIKTTDLHVQYLRKITCSDEDDLNVSTHSMHLSEENDFKDDEENFDEATDEKIINDSGNNSNTYKDGVAGETLGGILRDCICVVDALDKMLVAIYYINKTLIVII